jgi:1,4-dihydroxy-2-naphthoate polyprenyltransferase
MKHWIHAFRLRTLPLAISSILVGSALAWPGGAAVFNWSILGLALLTAVLLQVLSNLANDLGDHEHGTDNAERVGPMRAVQSGAISPAAMKRAMLLVAVLAFLSGLSLILLSLGPSLHMLAFLLLGLLAIAAAVKYTFGSNPYGYAGLGDISVFLFFGPVGVLGTYYLHTRGLHWPVLPPALALGLLSAAVLNVNNMRDIVNDAASGKRTLAVRLGMERSRTYHGLLLTVALVLLVRSASMAGGPWPWLFLVGFIPVLIHGIRVQQGGLVMALDPELKRLALGTFATAVTFSIGLLLT